MPDRSEALECTEIVEQMWANLSLKNRTRFLTHMERVTALLRHVDECCSLTCPTSTKPVEYEPEPMAPVVQFANGVLSVEKVLS